MHVRSHKIIYQAYKLNHPAETNKAFRKGRKANKYEQNNNTFNAEFENKDHFDGQNFPKLIK